MKIYEFNRPNSGKSLPTLAKSAAILLAIIAVTCATVLVDGLPFQRAHANAPEGAKAATVAPATDTTDAGAPAGPHTLAPGTRFDYFSDRYNDRDTAVEPPVATF